MTFQGDIATMSTAQRASLAQQSRHMVLIPRRGATAGQDHIRLRCGLILIPTTPVERRLSFLQKQREI